MKKIWIVLITFVVSAGLIGGGVYWYESAKNKNNTNDLNSQIALLNSQKSDLQNQLNAKTSTTTSSTSNSSTAAAAQTNELTNVKNACDALAKPGGVNGNGTNNSVQSYYYMENSDGEFADCVISDGNTGYNSLLKKINNSWMQIWAGNGNVSQATISQYKIPQIMVP
jgi:outer membrane murein-binding lipoprotein Lpp